MSWPDTIASRVRQARSTTRDLSAGLPMYLMVNGSLVVIWAVTGAGFLWPVFPIVAWGIGVAAAAWDAYSRDVPTETEIRREMGRLRTRS